jgi:hypothetical protein
MPILSGTRALAWIYADDPCGLESNLAGRLAGLGVYVIWHGGPRPRVIRVGYGDIGSRLASFRNDSKMIAYARFGALRAAWAEVPEAQARGIAKFLASRLRPIHQDAAPGLVVAIPATLPF